MSIAYVLHSDLSVPVYSLSLRRVRQLSVLFQLLPPKFRLFIVCWSVFFIPMGWRPELHCPWLGISVCMNVKTRGRHGFVFF